MAILTTTRHNHVSIESLTCAPAHAGVQITYGMYSYVGVRITNRVSTSYNLTVCSGHVNDKQVIDHEVKGVIVIILLNK